MRKCDLSAPLVARVRSLEKRMTDTKAGDAHAVHHARVASRRLRDVLRAVTAIGGKYVRTSLKRQVRRVTRALGTVREMHVTLALLDEEAKRCQWPQAVVADVRRTLEAERERREERMRAKLHAIDFDDLGRRARDLADEVALVPRAVWQQALVASLEQRSAAAVVALNDLGPLYVADRLHAVRIAAKKCRYSFELVQDSTGANTSAIVRRLKHLQDRLGRLQDLHVLEDFLRGGPSKAPTRRIRDAAPLQAMIDACDIECRALHAAVLASSARLASDIARATRTLSVALGAPRRMARIARGDVKISGHGPRARRAS